MRILKEKKDDFLDVYKAVFVHDKELLDLDDRFVYAPPAANVTWVVPDKQKIYEIFFRIGDEETRSTKGTGLGLFLVKEIVKLHGAQISCKDNLPKGTIFDIRFNLL